MVQIEIDPYNSQKKKKNDDNYDDDSSTELLSSPSMLVVSPHTTNASSTRSNIPTSVTTTTTTTSQQHSSHLSCFSCWNFCRPSFQKQQQKHQPESSSKTILTLSPTNSTSEPTSTTSDTYYSKFQFAFLDAVSEEVSHQQAEITTTNDHYHYLRAQEILPEFWKTILELVLWNAVFVTMAQYLIHTFGRKKITAAAHDTTTTKTTTTTTTTTPTSSSSTANHAHHPNPENDKQNQ